jgi:2-C-methyl-D-erythritol 4-phosphate cytidylyltransferase / 2-C-methyl-D-erythritol 2,4-cyclodiphosphate synthase
VARAAPAPSFRATARVLYSGRDRGTMRGAPARGSLKHGVGAAPARAYLPDGTLIVVDGGRAFPGFERGSSMSITARRHPPTPIAAPDPVHAAPTADLAGAVLVAAGVSSRMGGQDKVAADLGGRPVLAWSLDVCEQCPEIGIIAVVVHPERRGWVEALVRGGRWRTPIVVCDGGERRQDSVAAGVAALAEVDWVAVHDAARPFADVGIFQRCLAAARAGGGCALAAVPVRDTLKRVSGRSVETTLSRENLWAAQTPQVCRRTALLEGLELAAANGWSVSDEAMVLEQLHEPVVIVPSDVRNFKLTTLDDLALARILVGDGGTGEEMRGAGERSETLDEEKTGATTPLISGPPSPAIRPAPRVGFGYDIHRLGEGRRLVLGGVELAHDRGLEGHSDADVVLHAVMDALLGAAALGDIGRHFPPGDPAFLGADSRVLLRQVAALLRDAGFRTHNVDAMVVAEEPKLGLYIPEMRRRIAADLDVDVDLISIKATTNEGLGPEGRAEGISATAVASIGSIEANIEE